MFRWGEGSGGGKAAGNCQVVSRPTSLCCAQLIKATSVLDGPLPQGEGVEQRRLCFCRYMHTHFVNACVCVRATCESKGVKGGFGCFVSICQPRWSSQGKPFLVKCRPPRPHYCSGFRVSFTSDLISPRCINTHTPLCFTGPH